MKNDIKKNENINSKLELQRKNYTLSESTLIKLEEISEHLGFDNKSNLISLCVSYYYDKEIKKCD